MARSIRSNSPPDSDEERQIGTIKNYQPTPPTPPGSFDSRNQEAGSTNDSMDADQLQKLSLSAATPAELLDTGKVFDINFVSSWLHQKEKKSSLAYFKSANTPKTELSWRKDLGLTRRQHSERGRLRERARRVARRFLLVQHTVAKYLKQLLESTLDPKKEDWRSVNHLRDLARRDPQTKNALATDCHTISVLLIRLLVGTPSYTKLKVLELLQILAEEYMGKVLISQLGGFHILTQVMLLGRTTIDMKKNSMRLLCSMCEASETVGSFLKEGVAEGVMLELSIQGDEIFDEFSLLASTVRSEAILVRFMNSSHLLMERDGGCYAKAMSVLQCALLEFQGEGYQEGCGWDWCDLIL